MNYDEIVVAALQYSDRKNDIEINDNMDTFFRVVEARVNRKLQVQKMSVRTSIITIADQEYYGLPADFAGLRDIEVRGEDQSRARQTLHYLSPEQMNAYSGNLAGKEIFYTIIANQLQIMPPQENKYLELVYYQHVPPITPQNDVNWLSTHHPDAYIFGLMVEINAFTKDAEGAALWDGRFVTAIKDIKDDDALTRWSGTPLQIRLG